MHWLGLGIMACGVGAAAVGAVAGLQGAMKGLTAMAWIGAGLGLLLVGEHLRRR